MINGAYAIINAILAKLHDLKASWITSGALNSIDRLPALTTDKVWKGVAGRPSEVDMPAAAKSIATGSYTGNDTANRRITIGFKCSLVIIQSDGITRAIMVPSMTFTQTASSNLANDTEYNPLHATDGFTVSHGGSTNTMNAGSVVYYYWAISE